MNVKRLWSRYLWLFEDMVQLGVCVRNILVRGLELGSGLGCLG